MFIWTDVSSITSKLYTIWPLQLNIWILPFLTLIPFILIADDFDAGLGIIFSCPVFF